MPLIDSDSGLRSVIEQVRQAELVAIDTEFVWERTYYPNLGLVQLAIDEERVFLLDPVALDLEPLAAVLGDPSIRKLLHDAGQDLIILSRATGARPTGAFDTQLAAGFAGLGATISLQGLIAATVGHQLDKGATRSDWLRRPLSEEQLEYARDDVRYLPRAYAELKRRLQSSGRLEWALEEMLIYDRPDLYVEDDPRQRYRHARGRAKRGFGGRDYAVLRELAAWREEEARSQNRPRQHVLSDEALIELAERKPTTPQQLARLRRVPEAARSRYEQSLLSIVGRGLEIPRDEWPDRPRSEPDDPAITPRLDLVQALIRGRGLIEGVDPVLVSTRADIEMLVETIPPSPDHPVFTGWRRQFVGADLEALFEGRARITLDARGLPTISARQGA